MNVPAAILGVLLLTGAASWAASPAPPPVRAAFAISVTAVKPLGAIRKGEATELLISFANGSVYGIDELKLDLIPNENLRLDGPRGVRFHGIDGTMGEVETPLRLTLRGDNGRLTVAFTAKYGEDLPPLHGRAIFIVGHAPEAAADSPEVLGEQLHQNDGQALQQCWRDELPRRHPVADDFTRVYVDLEPSGAVAKVASLRGESPFGECLAGAVKQAAFRPVGKPTRFEVRLGLGARGTIRFVTQPAVLTWK